MKRHFRTIAVIASALMLPLALHAADTESAAKPKTEATPAAEGKDTSSKIVAAKSEAKCEYITGSRIRHKPPVDCDSGAPGLRVFSREDLLSTGAADMADALRMLDPRLQ
jgi:hypothetical protein